MKTPISYYGGKQSLSPVIIPMLPDPSQARLYCEPFVGGGAIFWAKPYKHEIEIINDLNGEVVNFYKVIKNNFEELKGLIQKETLHSRSQHDDAFAIYSRPHLFTPLQRAWAFWVATQQSFSSSISASWSNGKTSNSCEKKVNNSKINFETHLTQRLEQVQIECRDAVKIIAAKDTKESFFYCDPPYYQAAMGHYSGYTKQDFENLLSTLSNIHGKFLLSSYDCPLLNAAVKENKWQQKKLEIRVSAHINSRTKIQKNKIEVLTLNY
jgi:DNA adenine methylase